MAATCTINWMKLPSSLGAHWRPPLVRVKCGFVDPGRVPSTTGSVCSGRQANVPRTAIRVRKATVAEAPALAALQRRTALFAHASRFPAQAPKPRFDYSKKPWRHSST
jgi:hypothetical protein